MLTSDAIDQLAPLIVDGLTERMFRQDAVTFADVANYDQLAGASLHLPDARVVHVRQVLNHAEKNGKSLLLLEAILHRVSDCAPELTERLAKLLYGENASTHQAMLARRDNFLESTTLKRYFTEIEDRICCIYGQFPTQEGYKPTVGTGWLVGPDLVLTAMHVMQPVIDAVQTEKVPEYVQVYFDHVDHSRTLAIDALVHGNHLGSISRVLLAQDWMVASSPVMPGDGTHAAPDPTVQAQLATNLDFALIRLAEPAGRMAVDRNGGRRRHWIEFPNQSNPLGVAARIMISQHPNGSPRVYDVGRLASICISNTRFRYDTETAKGTSGAPCFDRNLQPVGLHVAAFQPAYLPLANQAVSIEHILPQIQAYLPGSAQPPEPPVIRWNLAKAQDKYEVVIGRRALLDWAQQAGANPEDAAMRIYIAESQDTGTGKTFSISVIDRIKATDDVLIVFDPKTRPMPDTVESFVAALFDLLFIPVSELAGMPPRPTSDLSGGDLTQGKQTVWASKTMPAWVAEVHGRHRIRKIDGRDTARLARSSLQDLGKEVPPDIQELADKTEAQWQERERWRLVWIAFDDFRQNAMGAELREFIAGSSEGPPNGDLPRELRRFRWLFLGDTPDFLGEENAVTEELHPNSITEAGIKEVVAAAWHARGRDPDEQALGDIAGMAMAYKQDEQNRGSPPAKQIMEVQRHVNIVLRYKLNGGNKP
ncbi:trypsin-like peptidase domain-containing protein [Asticcacaulis sp.]|uniref:trypsin-like peptidase domain-containing protein n=1 Tax=Asticcacaulis sp. TaxID=1872648 RepID=UPI0026016449|nr:trypsin-like peptidase domain-containing protein [Asticcacaulis sp.]